MAEDGQSHGPAIGDSGRGVASVVATLDYQTQLDDDQIELQLVNNHTIRDLIIAHKNNMVGRRKPETRLDTLTQEREQMAASRDEARETHANMEASADGVTDPILFRLHFQDQELSEIDQQIAEVSTRILEAEEALEAAILEKLEHAEDKLREMAEMLGGNNPDAVTRRAKIAELDSQIAPLQAQLGHIQPVDDEVRRLESSNGAGGLGELERLARGLDEHSVSPLSSAHNARSDYWKNIFDYGARTLEAHI